MSSSSPIPNPSDLPDDRERMLEVLETGIQEAQYKIEKGKIKDPEKERVRIKWVRALGYCVDKHRKLKKDADVEKLKKRMDQYEGGR